MTIKKVHVTVEGITRLVMHAWSEKAKRQMRDKHGKKAKEAKGIRNPEQECADAAYHLPNGRHAIPSIHFKCALVNACSFVENITKVHARGTIFVQNEFLEIISDVPIMREDVVRVGISGTDLRYRPSFEQWKVSMIVEYMPNIISDVQLKQLFEVAGYSIGVGEFRPQKGEGGEWGRFKVIGFEEIK